MVPLSTALGGLLRLQGLPQPDSPDRVALLERIGESPWLRFGVGVDLGDPMPRDDDEGVRAAALDFAEHWSTWCAYRDALIEIFPPGAESVRFRIAPEPGRAATPPTGPFPAATFAVLTAWNPGSGEPRPNERANRNANARLAAHLDARLCDRWPAVSAPGSRWREEGFCVLGLDLEEAFRFGESFQQRAIYYVEQGRPLLVSRRRGHIDITAGNGENSSVIVTITDSGPGISPNQQVRIFEPYYSTKEKGTGLGLAIVKHNVECYGGTVKVESEPGHGAQFTLQFPARALMNLHK